MEMPLRCPRTSEKDQPNVYLKLENGSFTPQLAATSSGIAVHELGDYWYGARTRKE